ncbi:MAG: TPM domain-containing protein [Gemmatimonadetes bacterium]|nr:TPM domain-containing protein [Gemmatimonadota bacterium]
MIPFAPVLLALTVALQQPPQIPAPTGFVNDFAEVLSPDDEARITRLVDAVRAGSQGEIAVVTLRDLAGRDVGDVALRIGREWRVGASANSGDRARNAGVVVLLVPKETSADGRGYISIQTGQGAEGFITDGMTGDIRREATPALQRGAYGEALTLITGRLAERYAAEFQFALDGTIAPKRATRKRPKIPPAAIIMVIFVLINVMSATRRGRRGGLVVVPFPLGRRGGGFGGGFGGGGFGGGGFGGFGGGGGFSGGGSSGSF